MRKSFIGGNWKMNTDGKSAAALAAAVTGAVEDLAAEKEERT